MSYYPNWQYEELKQVGVDYTDLEEVQAYDLQMQKLRDMRSEVAAFIKCVGLQPDHAVLEIGTGTGELALSIAQNCSKVYAVDVSQVMLDFARQKATERGLTNIEFCHGGFLTYDHVGDPPDVVVTQLALHHLPDFWKLIALRRIHTILRQGGKLYLRDTIYSFSGDHKAFLNNWISGIKDVAGEVMARDVEIAVRDEYSTYDWIIEGLLERAGFSIDSAHYQEGFMAIYVCTKRQIAR
ncbi:MAG: class I SAM-dependent methyltransferase [Bacillota bacterium]